MINKKKKKNLLKTEKFLNKFPIIILLQHHNLTVNDWSFFRQKIQEISDRSKDFKPDCLVNPAPTNSKGGGHLSVEILNIKNSLLKRTRLGCHPTLSPAPCHFNFLCQGPNLVIGCKTINQLSRIWDLVNSNSKGIFISCFYKNKVVNHLDLRVLLGTNLSIYQNLLEKLDIKTDFLNTLRNPLLLDPLFRVEHNLIKTLSFINYSKL